MIGGNVHRALAWRISKHLNFLSVPGMGSRREGCKEAPYLACSRNSKQEKVGQLFKNLVLPRMFKKSKLVIHTRQNY